jgi:histidinol dehydrogenase
MKILTNPPKNSWNDLVRRPSDANTEVLSTVREILSDVRQSGDAAVTKYTARFDKIENESILCTSEELESLASHVSSDLKKAINIATDNIRKFHEIQLEKTQVVETSPGIRCWRKSVGIEKVGLYIPSGTAPLFSTVLMLAIPAKIAGVREIIICTSPHEAPLKISPAIAYCCSLLRISKVYAVGGAQAIAAMAYGTATIPKVNKIFGPGNQYVTAAKLLANQDGVNIDMPAGPSEILVIADDSANPQFVAADLLSQAEHGPDSQVILLAKSQDFIDKTLTYIDEQITRLDRQHFARITLENSLAIIFDDLQEAVDFSNLYAPEHLVISTASPYNVADYVLNAGSVFLGNYSPESAGDYASGTNHTLPTGGYAASYSGVSVDSFCRKITFQEISKEGLKNLSFAIETMADAEGLEAHKEAVKIRLR